MKIRSKAITGFFSWVLLSASCCAGWSDDCINSEPAKTMKIDVEEHRKSSGAFCQSITDELDRMYRERDDFQLELIRRQAYAIGLIGGVVIVWFLSDIIPKLSNRLEKYFEKKRANKFRKNIMR